MKLVELPNKYPLSAGPAFDLLMNPSNNVKVGGLFVKLKKLAGPFTNFALLI